MSNEGAASAQGAASTKRAGQADGPAWEARFRAARVTLPDWAQDAPHRCLYVSNATGTYELYAWDRVTGTTRQATSRPNGTASGTVTPDGQQLWWFDDTDGDEHGVWRAQPFDGGPDSPAVEGLEPSYSAGLALGPDGIAVVGQVGEGGTRILLSRPGTPPTPLYENEQDAQVGDLSRDGAQLAIEHSEHGDSRHPAIRVAEVGSGPAGFIEGANADLWDGPGKGLEVLGFAPVDGDPRLLVGHERRGRSELLILDTSTGTETELEIDLPGEITGQWYQDGRALLIEHEHAARRELHRYDLQTGALEPLGTPRGVVSGATARPDGTVEYAWSSSAQPTTIRSSAGTTVLTPPGQAAPPSVPVEDLWVDGTGGRIHALVSRPASPEASDATARAATARAATAGDPTAGVDAPYPGIFLVHGGPTWQDFDSFAADAAAWVDAGFVVVRVNYRGSTGYGVAWRDAIEGRPGLTELEDLAAVRAAVVASGLLDPARIVLAGGSWGGYLTLLGLGTQPELWSLGIAAVPVADYVAAYEDEMEPLQAFDRSLFGGSPADVPEVYRRSDPITYVDSVRVPVLVLAGENDPRCPIRQIENYLGRLRDRGAPHEVYRYDAGHGSLVVEERIRQMRAELDFARRHLGPPGP